MSTRKLGYWFGGDELPHEDGRRVGKGVTLKVKPPLKLCKHGLHYSKHPFDAYMYSTKSTLWLVEDFGETLTSRDKCCTTARRHIAKIDARSVIAQWKSWCLRSPRRKSSERRKLKAMIDAEFRRIGAL